MSIEYGRLGPEPGCGGAVGLVAQAAYHLDELLPLREALRAKGIDAELLVPLPPKKPFQRSRPGVRRFRELLASTNLGLGGVDSEADLAGRLSAVVVMNDWGLPRQLVESLRDAGRPTFAWVEGVQDFGDVDTGQHRGAYTHVDHVFCLGDYGAEQLPAMACTVVGSARLRSLWNEPAGAVPGRLASVNSNFTYGVLTQHRRAWLRSVSDGCDAAQMPWILSRHAAERGLALPHRSSRVQIGELLAASSHHVGRFSTVCYEALVRGIELVYHNPHGEREPTFSRSRGAFSHTSSSCELAARLREPARPRNEVREGAEDFLQHHLRLDAGPAPSSMAADVIEALVG